jgi:predicted O-methyltransferase YrrM
VGVHSVKCNIPGADTRGYWAYLAATPLWLDEPQKLDQIAVVGLAGGTVARKLLDSFPDAHVDGVEIDGAVVEVGRRYFDNDDPRIRPIVMDGRSYMAATTRSYDLVLVDAYRQPYIPFHLVTREFFEVVKERLEEDGVLALNVASSHGTDMNLTAMIYRTLREVFPTVLVIDATNANDILIATTRPKATLLGVDRIESPDFAHLRALERVKLVLREKMLPEVPGWQDARVLTDDQAPVEMAWDLMALDLAG